MSERLDEIRERRGKVTSPPWKVGPDVPDLPYRYSNFVHGHNRAKARVLHSDDAEFIANAPDDIDYLLARAALVEELVEALKEWQRLDNLVGLDHVLRKKMKVHAANLTRFVLARAKETKWAPRESGGEDEVNLPASTA